MMTIKGIIITIIKVIMIIIIKIIIKCFQLIQNVAH